MFKTYYERGIYGTGAIGTAVCFGMLGVTMLGIFFTPPMYVLMQRFKRSGDGHSESHPGQRGRIVSLLRDLLIRILNPERGRS